MHKLLEKNGVAVWEDEHGKVFMKPERRVGVAVLANDRGEFVLIKQFRNPIESHIIQLPGGGVEADDESLEHAARREFKEETGYECGKVEYLGHIVPAAWRSDELTHCFYTEDIISRSDQQLEKHENIEVVRMKVSDCIKAAKENKLNDSELSYAIMQAVFKGYLRGWIFLRLKTLWMCLLALLLLVLASSAVYYIVPIDLSVSLHGVEYQLGEENSHYIKPVILHMDGKLSRSFSGKAKFEGVIDFEGFDFPIPKDRRKMVVNFYSVRSGYLYYVYIDKSGNLVTYSLGMIYANKNFTEFAIAKYAAKDEANPDQGGGWSGSDGFMMTFPGMNRDEALKRSNSIMAKYLAGYELR